MPPLTRVTVFNAKSEESFNQAIENGLSRAQQMVENVHLTITDYSVTKKKRDVRDDGVERHIVELEVIFESKLDREPIA